MALDDVLDDGEAQPGAARRLAAARVGAIEPAGQQRQVFGRDALALVGDLDHDMAAVARQPDLDVVYEPDRSRLATTVSALVRSGDVCVSMGCGDVESLPSEIMALRGAT